MKRLATLLILALSPAVAAQTVIAPAGTYTVTSNLPVQITYGVNSVTFTWGVVPTPTPPNPGPGPNPNPNPTPTPVDPAPIPLPGLRVLMVYESADLSKYPPAQLAVIYDQSIRLYLETVAPKGKDGKTPEYRIWDQNVVVGGDAEHWKAAITRPRKSLPWIVISNGTTGYEGPLPANVPDTLALIKKYEVKS